VQVGALVEKAHLEQVASPIPVVADMQRLVEIDDEVKQEFQGLPLPEQSRPWIAQYTFELLNLAYDATA
jgi:hypothetical protein